LGEEGEEVAEDGGREEEGLGEREEGSAVVRVGMEAGEEDWEGALVGMEDWVGWVSKLALIFPCQCR
jgi:hypothetical protein